MDSLRAANIDGPPKSVKGPARTAGLALLALAFLFVSGCGPGPRPAPPGAGAYWAAYLGDATRAPFLQERVSVDSPRVVWSANVGPGVRGMPIATDQVVIAASTDRQIYVLSRQDGSVYWRKRLDGPPVSPLLAGERIFALAENDGKLKVLELEQGDELIDLDLPSVRVPPMIHQEMLYVAAEDRTLRAIDPDEKETEWSTRLPARPVAGPVVIGSRILYFSADSIHMLNREDGERLRAAAVAGRIAGEVATDGSRLYATLETGELAAWDVESLEPLWQSSGFASFGAGPVAAGGTGYAVTRYGQVIRFDLDDGYARILADLQAPVSAAPVIVSNGMLIGSLEGDLFFLDRNGETRWRVDLQGSIQGPVYVHEGRMIVPMYGPVDGPLGSEPLRGKLMELRG